MDNQTYWRGSSVRGLLSGSAIVILLLATGCSESPVGWTDENVATTAKTDVPLIMGGEGELIGQDLAPDFGPPEFGKSTFDGRCSAPSDYLVAFVVRGEASHLGTFVASLEHCGLVDFQTGLATDDDGQLMITGANGDELRGIYDGRALGGGRFEGSVDFTGGTGRFAGASGRAQFSGQTDRSTGTIPEFDLSGVLWYDASDRSG